MQVDKIIGRKAAGTWGRPRRNNKTVASQAVRAVYKRIMHSITATRTSKTATQFALDQ